MEVSGPSAGSRKRGEPGDDAFFLVSGTLDADRIDVTFDEARGLPVSVSVDPSLSAVDEEHGRSVSEFREGACYTHDGARRP